MRADLAEFELMAGAAHRPPGIDRVVKQAEQPGLGGRVDPVRDPATQPQRPFPSTRVNRTAISLSASDSRAFSALAAASS